LRSLTLKEHIMIFKNIIHANLGIILARESKKARGERHYCPDCGKELIIDDGVAYCLMEEGGCGYSFDPNYKRNIG